MKERVEHGRNRTGTSGPAWYGCLPNREHGFVTGKPSLAYNACVLSDVFHALAAPARRAILDELHDRDGQTLFELCSRLTMKHELGLTRQAVSQHLQVLEEAGLVSCRRDGRYKFHYLDTTPLQGIAQRWSIEGGGR
jgi:DNA-binding transcriptional ArsR family regulator